MRVHRIGLLIFAFAFLAQGKSSPSAFSEDSEANIPAALPLVSINDGYQGIADDLIDDSSENIGKAPQKKPPISQARTQSNADRADGLKELNKKFKNGRLNLKHLYKKLAPLLKTSDIQHTASDILVGEQASGSMEKVLPTKSSQQPKKLKNLRQNPPKKLIQERPSLDEEVLPEKIRMGKSLPSALSEDAEANIPSALPLGSINDRYQGIADDFNDDSSETIGEAHPKKLPISQEPTQSNADKADGPKELTKEFKYRRLNLKHLYKKLAPLLKTRDIQHTASDILVGEQASGSMEKVLPTKSSQQPKKLKNLKQNSPKKIKRKPSSLDEEVHPEKMRMAEANILTAIPSVSINNGYQGIGENFDVDSSENIGEAPPKRPPITQEPTQSNADKADGQIPPKENPEPKQQSSEPTDPENVKDREQTRREQEEPEFQNDYLQEQSEKTTGAKSHNEPFEVPVSELRWTGMSVAHDRSHDAASGKVKDKPKNGREKSDGLSMVVIMMYAIFIMGGVLLVVGMAAFFVFAWPVRKYYLHLCQQMDKDQEFGQSENGELRSIRVDRVHSPVHEYEMPLSPPFSTKTSPAPTPKSAPVTTNLANLVRARFGLPSNEHLTTSTVEGTTQQDEERKAAGVIADDKKRDLRNSETRRLIKEQSFQRRNSLVDSILIAKSIIGDCAKNKKFEKKASQRRHIIKECCLGPESDKGWNKKKVSFADQLETARSVIAPDSPYRERLERSKEKRRAIKEQTSGKRRASLSDNIEIAKTIILESPKRYTLPYNLVEEMIKLGMEPKDYLSYYELNFAKPVAKYDYASPAKAVKVSVRNV